MAVALPSRPGEVPQLAVDPGLIGDYAADLLTASSQLDDLGSFAARDAALPGWAGDAATTYHQGIAPLGTRADALSLALRGVAVRAGLHGERMAALLTERAGLEERRATLLEQVAELEVALLAGIPADQVRSFRTTCDQVQARVTGLDLDVAAWAGRVASEETAMLAVLAAGASAELAERTYAGVADPADGVLLGMPGPGSPASRFDHWWDGLTREQRTAVIAAAPTIIGDLDGLPATARDAANRLALGKDLSALGSLPADRLTEAERRRLEIARHTRAALASTEGKVDLRSGAPIPTQLYLYDPAAFGGDGRVAVVVGDLDTADNVAVTVPGLGTTASSIDGQADRALNLYDAARVDDGGRSTAVLAWIGYDAPDFAAGPTGLADGLGVAGSDRAVAGGQALADVIDGLKAGRDDDPHLTVIGYSYGSTTAAFGAAAGMGAGDLVLAGSPGAGSAEHAADLGRAGHVWAIANSRDPVTAVGDEGWWDATGSQGLGRDPAEGDFGARRLQGESTHRWEQPDGIERLDPTAGWDPRDDNSRWDDHVHYYDRDTESLHNMAQVVNADYADTAPAGPRHDPWWREVQDPEWSRTPRGVDTDGDHDLDGARPR